MKEKVLNNKKNGMLVLILTTLLYLLSIAVCVVGAMIGNPLLLGISIFWMCVGWFPYCGLRVLKPQEALVLTLFGKVEMALDRLSEKKVVELDEERKAAMVSNLLVVLCGNKDAQPIVNSGSLY